jgi:hypothetical protein
MNDSQVVIESAELKSEYHKLINRIQQIFQEDNSSPTPLPIDLAVALDDALRKLRLWTSDVDDKNGGLMSAKNGPLGAEVLALFKRFREQIDILE